MAAATTTQYPPSEEVSSIVYKTHVTDQGPSSSYDTTLDTWRRCCLMYLPTLPLIFTTGS